MFRTVYTSGDEVERRMSVYERPLKSGLRKDDWTGPPFSVWRYFMRAEVAY